MVFHSILSYIITICSFNWKPTRTNLRGQGSSPSSIYRQKSKVFRHRIYRYSTCPQESASTWTIPANAADFLSGIAIVSRYQENNRVGNLILSLGNEWTWLKRSIYFSYYYHKLICMEEHVPNRAFNIRILTLPLECLAWNTSSTYDYSFTPRCAHPHCIPLHFYDFIRTLALCCCFI